MEEKKAGESYLFALAQQAMQDSDKWFGDTGVTKSLAFHALAMGGECGEFQNIIKKIERGSLDPRDANVRYNLMMELTDVFVYLLLCAAIMGLDLEKSYQMVRANNEKRFTAERVLRNSNSRPIKDIPQA